MKFLKRSAREKPRVSLILLDWSVRESFHFIHYLGMQNVERDQFEVLVIEYYSRESDQLRQSSDQVDTWVVLEMSESCIYHKHLMYNAGIVLSRGDIVVICDSDTMVTESFIKTIINEFDRQDRIVLHLDQFRNLRKDFYPFNYPTFEDVLGDGCINHVAGKTKGILDTVDPLHSRNYGACMCVKRADLIAIGGADEHIDYLGHICGPYEMTFRLMNNGLREIWHDAEYLYHTWHPGQAGVDNYQGPHDGKQLSSTALEALVFKRVRPLVENKMVQLMRNGEDSDEGAIAANLIDKRYLHDWDRTQVERRNARQSPKEESLQLYRGYKIDANRGGYCARRLIDSDRDSASRPVFQSTSLNGILRQIDQGHPGILRLSELVNSAYWLFELSLWSLSVPIAGTVKAFYYKRGQSALRTLLDNLKKHKAGWLAMRQYAAYMSCWINSLVATLYFLKRERVSASYQGELVLVTTSRYVGFYLAILRMAKLLPPIRIIKLRNSGEIKAYLEALPSQKYPAGLILARDIYTRHYGLFRSYFGIEDTLIL